MVYPISGGKCINVVAVVHNSSKEGTRWKGWSNVPVDRAEFLSHFKGWEEELQALIYVRSAPRVHWVDAHRQTSVRKAAD